MQTRGEGEVAGISRKAVAGLNKIGKGQQQPPSARLPRLKHITPFKVGRGARAQHARLACPAKARAWVQHQLSPIVMP